MTTEKIKFIRAEYFEEPTTISNVVEYLSSYMNVRGTESIDGLRTVLWSKFVSCDYNDIQNNDEHQIDAILIVGTEGGIQVHQLGVDGKLCLLYSSAIIRVDAATVLPSPQVDLTCDLFVKDRPLIGAVFESMVSFYSMVTGRCVKEVTYQTDFVDICATGRVIVASSRSQLVLLCPCQLRVLTSVLNCRPCPYLRVPVAHCISQNWLAFAAHLLDATVVSVGGDLSDPSDKPYALSLLDMKKRMTPASVSEDGDKGTCHQDEGEEAGLVSIVRVEAVLESVAKGSSTPMKDGHMMPHLLMAHFTAHRWSPLHRMVFDPAGTLLLTTCEQGLFCHLFRIVPHPTSCSQTAVVHLYRLCRGETPRLVVSLAVSKDCRLAAAASDHGTVHVWPISSYGGPLCVRTHCQGHVVNRLSRLERSAGMQEHQVTRPTQRTAVSVSTDAPPNQALHPLCPRLPPLPYPYTLNSYAQLKPLSLLPTSYQHRPLALTPLFCQGGHTAYSPTQSYARTEWILVLSPDSRLLQYALCIHPDTQNQPLAARTEIDGPFVIEKRSYLQWRIPSSGVDVQDHNVSSVCHQAVVAVQGRQVRSTFQGRDSQSAMLHSVTPELSESLEQLNDDNAATPQCWFSNIDISSQISFTSSIRRQDKFTMSTYQGKEPSDARLEVLQKSPSVSSQLSNHSWRAEDRTKDDGSSQPVGVPLSEHRIQICNSFCGSSISDGAPDYGDNVVFALAHAIQDEDGPEETALELWEEPRTGYIEYMTRDMGHVRLRRVSGSFSSDVGRLPMLSTSPAQADIPEEMHGAEHGRGKQQKRHEKKKRKS